MPLVTFDPEPVKERARAQEADAANTLPAPIIRHVIEHWVALYQLSGVQ